MAGRSDGRKVSELMSSLKSVVKIAEEVGILQGKLQIEVLEKLTLEEKCKELEEERDELRNRLKEKDDDLKEIIELKKKLCELECENLRANTDLDINERRFKDLEFRVLSLEKKDSEKDDSSVSLTIAETIAGKGEAISETSANPSDCSSYVERTGGGKFMANTKKHVNKTSRAVKDPNKPKRPPTTFFVFMKVFRRTYKNEYPEIKSVAAIGRAGVKMWKSLSEAEKGLFVAYAEKRKAEYEKKMIAFNKEHDEQEDRFEKSESDEEDREDDDYDE